MVGGSQSTWREPSHTWGEHANTTQKGPNQESNLKPVCCEAMVLATTPPCSHIHNYDFIISIENLKRKKNYQKYSSLLFFSISISVGFFCKLL